MHHTYRQRFVSRLRLKLLKYYGFWTVLVHIISVHTCIQVCVCVLHYEQNIWKGKLAICHSACLVAKADLIGFCSTTFLNNDFLEAYTIYSTLCQGTDIKKHAIQFCNLLICIDYYFINFIAWIP